MAVMQILASNGWKPLPMTGRAFAGKPGHVEGVEVVLYAIEGGGNTWPGGLQYAPENTIGRTTRNLDASEAIWAHFKHHRRKADKGAGRKEQLRRTAPVRFLIFRDTPRVFRQSAACQTLQRCWATCGELCARTSRRNCDRHCVNLHAGVPSHLSHGHGERRF